MKALSPQTTLNELVERLSVFNIRNQPNDIEFRSLLNDASKLQKADAFEGFVMSGLIYSVRNNYKKTKENFEKALNISSESMAVLNYSMALKAMGRFKEAYDIVEKYYRPDDEEIVFRAYVNSLCVGYFDKAREYCKALVAFPSYSSDYEIYTKNSLKLLDDHQINVSDLSEIYLFILPIIFEFNIEPISSKMIGSVDDESLILVFTIDAPAQVISNIQFTVCQKYLDLDIPTRIKQTITPVFLKG